MEYIQAKENHAEKIYNIVQETIQTTYPRYYRGEIVDFFCRHHSLENISKDIKCGLVGLLICGGQIVGTGCYTDNHITRVYVAPEFQRQGYGSYIMQCLERQIAKVYDTVYLDASLPAARLYEKRGYKTIRHEKYPVENGVVLVYEVMEKCLADTK